MTRADLKSKTPEQLFTLFWENARQASLANRPQPYNRLVDHVPIRLTQTPTRASV